MNYCFIGLPPVEADHLGNADAHYQGYFLLEKLILSSQPSSVSAGYGEGTRV
jgi:hypothetical protein